MLVGIDASRAVTQQRTGTEAYAYFLIDAFLPIALEKGHQVRLYFNQPPPSGQFFNHALDHRVEQIIIPFPRLWTHGRLGVELFKRPPDVFFTPSHVIPYPYSGPAIATVHDLGYHYFPEAHPKSQLSYLKWSTQHNCRRSQIVVADSIATKKDIEKFYGTSSEKISIIYPGIDPQLSKVQEQARIDATLQKYQIKAPFLLYVGTLQPRKNLIRLIDAFEASHVNQHLVLAGRQGWLAKPILAKISSLPPLIKERIILTGYISDEEKAALLSAATALLFPSLYEGFGFPLLEAQACETAVLCANSSSLPEVAGKGALFIDPLETESITTGIQQISTDETLRQTLIEKGAINVKQFNWDTAAYQLLTLLTKIAKKSKK